MSKDKKLDELMFLLFTTKKIVWERAKSLEDIDLSSALRFSTLQFVLEKKNPTMNDLAKYLRVKPPSATSLINGLVKSGFIGRKKNKNDRRIVNLHATIKGKKYFKASFLKMRENIKSIYSHLNNKEIDQLIKILKKIAYVYNK